MSINKFRTENGKGIFTLNVALNGNVIKYIDELADLTGKAKEVLEKEIKENYLENVFFKIVSLILERATYGQHSLEINYQDAISTETDILITKNNTDAFGSRIWNSGHIEFSIDHIYSPGLMLHELGHYLYGLGDEYKGCRRDKNDRASIMEYSFGNNVRFRKKGQEKEYKVLEGFDGFWGDFVHGIHGIELKYKENEVVTDFCHDSEKGLEHNIVASKSEHHNKYGISCWAVMLRYRTNGKQDYTLEDPFDEIKKEFDENRRKDLEKEIMAFDPNPELVG